MRLDVISIFPDYLAPLDLSLIGKARRDGLVDLRVHDLRDFAHDRHRTVDDTPYGGGAGMVMTAQPWSEALTDVLGTADAPGERPVLIVPGPGGQPFDQAMARELSGRGWLAFACGRYEGIDERVYEWAAERMEVRVVSLGDYVLNGGEVAAMAMIEAVVRLLPGVVGNAESLVEESHEGGLLEYPLYTKPAEWDGRPVPEVLLSGDHARIERWRHQQRLERTAARRPDLLPRSGALGVDGLADLDHGIATPAEVGEIVTLQKACWSELTAEPRQWRGAPAEGVEEVQADLKSWTTHTFRSEGRLVASVRVRRSPEDPQVWQIERLMVAPDLQGRGLGHALIGYAERLAPPDVTTFVLEAGHDIAEQRRMFRKAGYKVVGPGPGTGTVELIKRRP